MKDKGLKGPAEANRPTCKCKNKIHCQCGTHCGGTLNGMDEFELKAEVFRVIRSNVDLPKSKILSAIKEHLPKATKEDIKKALDGLMD